MRRFFVLFPLLAVVLIAFFPPSALARSKHDHTIEKHLPGEADQYLKDPSSSFPLFFYLYVSGESSSSTRRECLVCGASPSYCTSEKRYIDKNLTYYDFYCSACRTKLTEANHKSDGNGYSGATYIEMFGEYGSPLIGKVTQFTDLVGNFARSFLSFIVSNWLVLIIIAIPIFGICLTLIFRFKKGV